MLANSPQSIEWHIAFELHRLGNILEQQDFKEIWKGVDNHANKNDFMESK